MSTPNAMGAKRSHRPGVTSADQYEPVDSVSMECGWKLSFRDRTKTSFSSLKTVEAKEWGAEGGQRRLHPKLFL